MGYKYCTFRKANRNCLPCEGFTIRNQQNLRIIVAIGIDESQFLSFLFFVEMNKQRSFSRWARGLVKTVTLVFLV